MLQAGDGAAFTAPDGGQFGANPCNDDPAFKGAFRVQNPNRWNGKIMRVNPVTLEQVYWFKLYTLLLSACNYPFYLFTPNILVLFVHRRMEIFATGVRNPFRLGRWGDNIVQSETGWYTYEEVNIITQGANLGWPCFEGPEPQQDYVFFNHPTCQNFLQNGGDTKPFLAYKHPADVAGNVASVSAVSGWCVDNQTSSITRNGTIHTIHSCINPRILFALYLSQE
jgi:hypothetical protein